MCVCVCVVGMFEWVSVRGWGECVRVCVCVWLVLVGECMCGWFEWVSVCGCCVSE